MNIKRAKNEIKDTIEAYLQKDEFGEYEIPAIRQRPVLLMGPPGIGKKQIMEQVAKECRINLVAYTITHHTRQSAVGLPFIRERQYQKENYSVTEYTMSEIIASVYEKIEKTGIREGILFIDEINCVSETLAPTMLQFLQCKTFGNRKIPGGWIIVAAGNPPQYNKSVREFDVVTLDRIKKIDVTEDYGVWKEYAYHARIHPAVIAYLDIRKEHFYKIETTVEGKLFATARGWEDLSQFMKVYEGLGKTVDREIVAQYIQNPRIAKEFANYLELYQKYRADYQLEGILQGKYSRETIEQLKFAKFDERYSVIGFLCGKLQEAFRNLYNTEQYTAQLFDKLKAWGGTCSFKEMQLAVREEADVKEEQEQMTKEESYIFKKICKTLDAFSKEIRGEQEFEQAKELFEKEAEKEQQCIQKTGQALEHVFDFLEEAFTEGQEMVAFITDLNSNFYSISYLKNHGCDRYHRYNKGLLPKERHAAVRRQLEEVEGFFAQ